MPTHPRLLTFTAVCLAAGAMLHSCREIEDGVCHVTGAEIPHDWIPTEPKKETAFTQPYGERVRSITYDLSRVEPFAAYCGQVLHFSPECAIKRWDYAGGIDFSLIDHTPLPGGIIDAYSIPVQKGKLLAVRGWRSEAAPKGSDTFSTKQCKVEALFEVQHPDTTVNQGKPLYLIYNLGHEDTKDADKDIYTNIKRAPWEPADTPETRSIASLFEQVDKATKQEQSSAE